jgi:hypothetical protein
LRTLFKKNDMKKIFTLIAAVACFSAVHAQQLSTAARQPVAVSTDAGSMHRPITCWF